MSDKENWWWSATVFPKARRPNGALQLLSSWQEPPLRPALPEKWAACPAANPDGHPTTNKAGVMVPIGAATDRKWRQNRSLSVAALTETPAYGSPRLGAFGLLIKN